MVYPDMDFAGVSLSQKSKRGSPVGTIQLLLGCVHARRQQLCAIRDPLIPSLTSMVSRLLLYRTSGYHA